MSTSAGQANAKHVLLVCPLSFSYHEAISEALRRLGYRVTWWDDRARTGTAYKLSLRLLPRWTMRRTQQVFLDRLATLDAASVSHVLVVKGEGMAPGTIQAMRRALPGASFGYYLWDGLENVRCATDIAGLFDSVATFDPQDAKQRRWTYRPLFARRFEPVEPARTGRDLDWCFIGTLHSDRHRVIHRIRRKHGPSQASFVFGYFPGKLVRALRYATDWTLWFAPSGTLSIVPMRPDEVQAVVARSKSVLDVEHPSQRGFTMRTIETIFAGKKLITTNPHIVDSDLYHPSRVHVISRTAPDIPASFVNSAFEPAPSDVIEKYSIDAWITELLALQERTKPLSPPVAPAPAST